MTTTSVLVHLQNILPEMLSTEVITGVRQPLRVHELLMRLHIYKPVYTDNNMVTTNQLK